MNHKVDVIITVYNERRPEKFRLQDLHPSDPYHSSTVYEPTESWYTVILMYFDKQF